MSIPVRDAENIRNSLDEKDLSGKDSDTDEQEDREMKAIEAAALEKHMKSKEYGEDYDDVKPKNRLTPQKAASPMVIQWLQDNYEAAEGTSLPRSTLYAHYVSFCSSMNIEPVNAASFGKLIRSIFPNLKTRRLGTRGHSKYHYYGIRIKATSELRLPNFSTGTMMGAGKAKGRGKGEFDDKGMGRPEDAQSMYELNGHGITTGATHVTLPDFMVPDNFTLPPGQEYSMDHLHAFFVNYKQHNQNLIDAVYRHLFLEVDKTLQQFWQSLPPQYRVLLQIPEVVELVADKDQLTYKAMATVLLPNVLQALPVSIPQAIRQFAKQLETWLTTAMEGLPQLLVQKKLNVVKKFSQSLHKQASLNHLTQAARAVLQNSTQVSQMIIDWNRLDFEFITDQASWICQCGNEFIASAQEDFKRFLTERATLEQWAQWLQDIVNKILGKCADPRELVVLAQQLLLKWSFYSTLIIRDLTIRNASSFGSFHLLRTLFDEYIFYLVETKFASLVHQPQPMHNLAPAYEVPQTTSLQDTYQPAHASSMESFSLDTLLNKENGSRMNKLPYPFQQDNTDKPTDEEYARLEMLQHPEVGLMHLNVQPFQQYQRAYNNQFVQQPTGPMVPPMANMLRNNVGMPADHKRSATEMRGQPPHQVVYYQMPQGMPDPNMQRAYNPYEMQQQPMHYREQPDPQQNSKKIRLENTAEVK